jgi:hypothetical protein
MSASRPSQQNYCRQVDLEKLVTEQETDGFRQNKKMKRDNHASR